MPFKRKYKVDFKAAADRYGVSERTTRRWHKQGADLNNLESVANVILRQREPNIEALKSLDEQLTD